MKLASLKTGSRDGTLIVVSRDLERYTPVPLPETLQQALEAWSDNQPLLETLYQQLNEGEISGLPLEVNELASPLPRAYQWLDGSAYLSHVERVRRARGAEMPPSFLHDPLMYQGGSDTFLGPRDEIVAQEAWGIDLEAEVAVITDDVPMGVSVDEAGTHIRLVMLVNDVSLRNLIPNELAKGFGFLHGKPPSAFSPVAVTPNELGEAWRDHKLHLPLLARLNGQLLGHPNAGVDMQFSFAQLIAHAATTRPLAAGTIIGSGTVSNQDQDKGVCCLAERRVLEIIEKGEAKTPFLKHADEVMIEMENERGENLFGAIVQRINCQESD